MSLLPPAAAVAAFGLRGPAVPITGGEGRSVRVGAAVLKPVTDAEEATWCARVLREVDQVGFRVPRPLASRDGRYVVEGWTAAELVAGHPGPAGRWPRLLAAADAFHAALRTVPRPAFLDRRTHRWAVADRVAWGEAAADPLGPVGGPLRALLVARRPAPPAAAQVVHGDLSGNVLFAEGLPPAVIDFSPYWRPAGYAAAVAAVDGLLWHGAGRSLLELADADPQLLVRALIFRLVALNEMCRDRGPDVLAAELRPFRPVVRLVAGLARRGGGPGITGRGGGS